jgi:predicted MFS family arabinose efflux permease
MTPARLLLLMCAAETFSMAGFSTVPALLPVLQGAWHLSGSEAGALGGSFFAGYILAISWLTTLTDRVDAKRVYVGGALLGGTGSLAFAALANGLWSGCLFQALAGAGLAGTYMPGLRALTDRMEGSLQSRFIAFYTSTFGIGASLSYVESGWAGQQFGWPAAFCVAGFQPLLAGLLVQWLLEGKKPSAVAMTHSVLKKQWNALKNVEVRRYVLGYAAHCWELFGFRAWIVALLTYSGTRSSLPMSATVIAALVNLVGIPASILGNESAALGNRRTHILRVMLVSGLLAWVSGLIAPYPLFLIWLLPVYFVFVMADSAALTAGLVAATPTHIRGAAMAVYSLGGFGAGFLAPLAIGIILDLAGGQKSALAWLLACGSMGLWNLLMAAFGWRKKPSAEQ